MTTAAALIEATAFYLIIGSSCHLGKVGLESQEAPSRQMALPNLEKGSVEYPAMSEPVPQLRSLSHFARSQNITQEE